MRLVWAVVLWRSILKYWLLQHILSMFTLVCTNFESASLFSRKCHCLFTDTVVQKLFLLRPVITASGWTGRQLSCGVGRFLSNSIDIETRNWRSLSEETRKILKPIQLLLNAVFECESDPGGWEPLQTSRCGFWWNNVQLFIKTKMFQNVLQSSSTSRDDADEPFTVAVKLTVWSKNWRDHIEMLCQLIWR